MATRLGASLFFQPEPVVINSYELCKLAEHFVKAKGMTDHSVAELVYIDDDKGTGYADGFASHSQAELITETTNGQIFLRRIFNQTGCPRRFQVRVR